MRPLYQVDSQKDFLFVTLKDEFMNSVKNPAPAFQQVVGVLGHHRASFMPVMTQDGSAIEKFAVVKGRKFVESGQEANLVRALSACPAVVACTAGKLPLGR